MSPALRPCYWIRIDCIKCGRYDIAEEKPLSASFTECRKCGLPAPIKETIVGKTTRPMPYVGEIQPDPDFYMEGGGTYLAMTPQQRFAQRERMRKAVRTARRMKASVQ